MRNQLDFWNGGFGFSPVLDQLFEDVVRPVTRHVRSEAVLAPACDVEETEAAYLLTLDMPGVSQNDIKVEVTGEQLVVTGEKKFEKTEHKGERHLTERAFGRFHRAFTLGKAVDSAKIEATYKDGVLQISVPKAEVAKPRVIEVKPVH